jgi:hypothetical protein
VDPDVDPDVDPLPGVDSERIGMRLTQSILDPGIISGP